MSSIASFFLKLVNVHSFIVAGIISSYFLDVEMSFISEIQMNKLQDAVFFHESVTRLKYLHTAVINP